MRSQRHTKITIKLKMPYHLKAYTYELSLRGYKTVLLSPIPFLEDQKGHTCKIVSVSNALNYYYASNQLNVRPLATYKNGHKLFHESSSKSAREVAKKYAGSQVGEIYNEVTLRKLIYGLGNEMNDATVTKAKVQVERFNPDQKSEYINFIKRVLDEQKIAPIVFFDVDMKGFPLINGNGEREHAALVLGYIEDNKSGTISFILGHWSKYYIVDGNALANSAANLQMTRKPETFFKVKYHDDDMYISDWDTLNENGVGEHTQMNSKLRFFNTIITPSDRLKMKYDTPLKIPDHHLKFIKKLGGDDELRRESGFNLAVCVITPAPKLELEENNTPSINYNGY